MEKHKNFETQKRNSAKNDFDKEFYKLLNIASSGVTMESVRIGTKVDFIEKDEHKKIIKRQSKLIFNGLLKFYTNYDCYTFKQNDVMMDKPIYLRSAVLELSKLLMYETNYDELQQYFGHKNLHLPYMDCDCFVLSIETQNDFTVSTKS